MPLRKETVGGAPGSYIPPSLIVGSGVGLGAAIGGADIGSGIGSAINNASKNLTSPGTSPLSPGSALSLVAVLGGGIALVMILVSLFSGRKRRRRR